MDEELKRQKLNKLETKLYSRKTKDIIDPGRTDLKEEENEESSSDVENGSWKTLKKSSFDELASKASRVAESKHGFIKKILIFSIIFFILSVGVASTVFLGGINLISTKKVDIKVEGPLSVPAGQETSFDIKIINNNSTDLVSASLIVEYPKGTRSMSDMTKDFDRERFTLKNIKRGEEYVQQIKVVFFGEKAQAQSVKISLEYRVDNSSALFYKDKIHEFTISSSPVIVTPTYPKEVNSNQEISFNIEVASNSSDVLNDFLVNIEYPFGFVLSSASPSASFSDNVWKFAKISPGEKKTIKLRGSIIGQDNEERVFHIEAGTANKDDERQIGVPLVQLAESILVKKPFIGVVTSVNGKDEDYKAVSSGQIGADINITNNLSTRLFNASVEVTLSGAAFDPLFVSPNNDGFFQSINNKIVWDKRSVSNLSDIAPGDDEKLSFRVSPRNPSNIPANSAPEIVMDVVVRGERVLDSGSVEQVVATSKRKIILSGDVVLLPTVVRSLGSIENFGDVPPKVNKVTTYTIIWSIKNNLNQISNVEVRAKLPTYVSWTGIISPNSEKISFNEVTNEVVWDVGSLLPNTGSGKQASFQVEFLPSISQLGQAPYIVSEATISGIDKVTGLKINNQVGAVTTNFSSDPTFKIGDDKVVQ